jgi:beta-glucuronidase
VVRTDGDFPTSGNRPRQEYFHDFFNFGGIHRPVLLCSTPREFVSAIRAIPWREGEAAGFEYELDAVGEGGASVRLLDEAGAAVAASEGARGRLAVPEPRWWNPGAPYLYTLEARLAGGDIYRLPVGLRTVAVCGDRFEINGKPFYFRGFGKHEDSDLLGKGHSDAVMIKDFALMEWCGANSFRTSHYPYAEEILRHADRTGIVVIGELPAVGFNFTPDCYRPIFHPGRVDGETREHHLQTLREMVARDINHPSVVAWSLANEAATQEPASRDYFAPVFAEARALDGSRPITVVMSAFPAADQIGDLADFLCVNRYYGWYHDVGRLETVGPNLDAELRAWHARYGKPVLLSEYGADAVAGFHQDPPAMFSEEFQVEMLRETHAVLDRLPFVVGEHVWNFADFATSQGLKRMGGNKKGVFTRQRQPKLAAHYLRERWKSRA